MIDDGDECELRFGTDDLDWGGGAPPSQPRHRSDRAELVDVPADEPLADVVAPKELAEIIGSEAMAHPSTG